MNRHLITDLDIYENKADISYFKSILKKLVDSNKTESMIFQFRGEDNFFLKESELINYNQYISAYFRKNGKYKIVRQRDKHMFDSFGIIQNFDNNIYDFIIYTLKYFYGCSFFIPYSKEVWLNLIENYEEYLDNINGIKFFNNNLTTWVFIKGMDGDCFKIIYEGVYPLE